MKALLWHLRFDITTAKGRHFAQCLKCAARRSAPAAFQNDERGKLGFARQDDGQATATITDKLELILLHEIRPEKLDLDTQITARVQKARLRKVIGLVPVKRSRRLQKVRTVKPQAKTKPTLKIRDITTDPIMTIILAATSIVFRNLSQNVDILR
jgi:hypothetical protein